MKKYPFLFLLPLLLGAACIAVNSLLAPLPDWLVRAAGVALLLSLFLFVFTLVRTRRPGAQ